MDEIEVGARYQDTDWRNEGRVVEVRTDLGNGYYSVQVEAHPKNPGAIGRYTTVSAKTLNSPHRYRKISR